MILMRHPIMKGSKYSRITVYLSSFFVFGCGITHLVEVYTVIQPAYEMQANINFINGLISVLATFFVVYGLLRSVAMSEKVKRTLEERVELLER